MAKALFPKAAKLRIPDFHEEIYALLQDNSKKRRAIKAPRGHAKSTLTSFFYPMWKIITKHPDDDPRFIVIVSESQDQAINFLSDIKMEIEENARLRYYFGDLKGEPWGADDIVTSNGVRIKAVGTRQKVRGMIFRHTRPTDIILDDFESEGNSLTHDNRSRNKDWVSGAVEPSLAHDGILTAIGTVIHNDTWLQDVEADPTYKTLRYDCEMDSDNKIPLWPENKSWDQLMAIKESYRRRGLVHMYYQEYRNMPSNPEEQLFLREDFRFWSGRLGVKDGHSVAFINNDDGSTSIIPVNIFVGIDPAISSRGDFNCIMPVGVASDGRFFVGDYLRFRGEPDRVIKEMFQMQFRYKPLRFIVETTAYQEALAIFARKEMIRKNIYFPIFEVKPRVAKNIRIAGMQPYFRAHQVHLKENQSQLEAELLAYPKGKNDDTLDALHNCIENALECAMGSVDDFEDFYEEEVEVDWMSL